MAINLVLNNIIQTTFYTQLGDQTGINVRHWKLGVGPGTTATATAFATACMAHVLGQMRAVLPTEAIVWGMKVEQLTGSPLPAPYIFRLTALNDGQVAGGYEPRQLSVLIQLKTDVAGRANRGRYYQSFLPKANVSANGLVAVAAQPNYTELAGVISSPFTFAATGGSARMDPQIYHKATKTSSTITYGFASVYVATQRRRGSWGRPNLPPE